MRTRYYSDPELASPPNSKLVHCALLILTFGVHGRQFLLEVIRIDQFKLYQRSNVLNIPFLTSSFSERVRSL